VSGLRLRCLDLTCPAGVLHAVTYLKLPIALAGLAAAVVLAPPVASAQGPTEDSVVARGFDPTKVITDIDVRSGPSGESPTGQVVFHFGGGLGPTYNTHVTCLAVSGKTAVIGFVGTLNTFLGSGPIAGLLRVTDGGGPGSSLDMFEGPVATNQGPPTNPPPDCSTFPATGFVYDVYQSAPDDIVVTDAPPFPTSKDQCKNGGWQTFGVFKNQGDCVSFVATGGKNPPGTTG
jgi:hypothetical protein